MAVSKELLEGVKLLEKERGIEAETLLSAIEEALLAAYKKMPDARHPVRVVGVALRAAADETGRDVPRRRRTSPEPSCTGPGNTSAAKHPAELEAFGRRPRLRFLLG